MRAVKAKRLQKAIAESGERNVKMFKRFITKRTRKSLTSNPSQLTDKGAAGRREGRKPHEPNSYGLMFRKYDDFPHEPKGKRLTGKSRKVVKHRTFDQIIIDEWPFYPIQNNYTPDESHA